MVNDHTDNGPTSMLYENLSVKNRLTIMFEVVSGRTFVRTTRTTIRQFTDDVTNAKKYTFVWNDLYNPHARAYFWLMTKKGMPETPPCKCLKANRPIACRISRIYSNIDG